MGTTPDSSTWRLAVSGSTTMVEARAQKDLTLTPFHGRVLSQIISSTGNTIGKIVDILARKLGWGPTPAAEHILEILGQYDRDFLLEKLRVSFNDLGRSGIPALAEPCKRLLLYTHPTEAAQTQLVAFKSIVMLTTSYPGLRYCFLLCKGIKGATDPNTAAMKMWERTGAHRDREWDLFSQLAAACISAGEVAEIVENSPPGRMGVVSEEGGVIDNLLRLLACWSVYEVSGLVAIRYLGGIVKLPTFWMKGNYDRNQHVAGRMFQIARRLLEDIGLGSSEPLGLITEKISDTEGIDVLAQAAVAGVKVWRSQISAHLLESQRWADDFMDLIKVLLRPDAKKFAPKSWEQALEFAEYPYEPTNDPDHSDAGEEVGMTGGNGDSNQRLGVSESTGDVMVDSISGGGTRDRDLSTTKKAQRLRWGSRRKPVRAHKTILVAGAPSIPTETAASIDEPSIESGDISSDQESERNQPAVDVTTDSESTEGRDLKTTRMARNHRGAPLLIPMPAKTTVHLAEVPSTPTEIPASIEEPRIDGDDNELDKQSEGSESAEGVKVNSASQESTQDGGLDEARGITHLRGGFLPTRMPANRTITVAEAPSLRRSTNTQRLATVIQKHKYQQYCYWTPSSRSINGKVWHKASFSYVGNTLFPPTGAWRENAVAAREETAFYALPYLVAHFGLARR